MKNLIFFSLKETLQQKRYLSDLEHDGISDAIRPEDVVFQSVGMLINITNTFQGPRKLFKIDCARYIIWPLKWVCKFEFFLC